MPDHLSNTGFFSSDNHLTEQGIAACAEALLEGNMENLLPELQVHLENCESCRREVVELYGLVATMPPDSFETSEQDGAEQAPAAPRAAIPVHPAWRWSLVALTALLAFWVFRNTQQSQLPQPPQLEKTTPAPEQLLNPGQKQDRPVAETKKAPQTAPEAKEEALLAANFVPDDQLESLSGEVYRSNGFAALSPSIRQVFSPGSEILFQWKQEGLTSLQLIVLDNLGKELIRREVSGSDFTWTSPKRPGLYYWKLESTEDLLYTGNFLLQ